MRIKAGRTPLTRRVAIVTCCATAAVAAAATVAPQAVTIERRAAAELRDVELLAASALIMTGTAMHVVDQAWIQMAIDDYVQPTLGAGYTGVPVQTPAQFWPFSGPEDMFFDLSVEGGTEAIVAAIAAQGGAGADTEQTVVFGYSQSAVIATAAKRLLTEDAGTGSDVPAVSFVMLANLNRPNGGINSRFTGAYIQELGWTFSAAAPTDTPFRTVDVARQYDLFADFPQYPLNLFATANALIAVLYGAHDYTTITLNPADPGYNPNTVVQQLGDTTYYLIPATTLPLLQPLRDLGADPVLLDAMEPALRVLVEFGYDRSASFGQPATASLTQREDFDQLGKDLAAAIEQGRSIAQAGSVAEAAAPVQLPAQSSTPVSPAASARAKALSTGVSGTIRPAHATRAVPEPTAAGTQSITPLRPNSPSVRAASSRSAARELSAPSS